MAPATSPNARMQAQVVGDVSFREGDGPMLPIRRGPVEVETTGLDALISWTDGDISGSAALPLADYQRYVKEGAIRSA